MYPRVAWNPRASMHKNRFFIAITGLILPLISGCLNTHIATGTGGSGSSAGITSINHIVFLAQKNRSFDHYFGAMRQYWSQNGFPDQAFDGLPQFNPGGGAAPTNPGC